MPGRLNDHQLPDVAAMESQCAFKPLGCEFPDSLNSTEMNQHYQESNETHAQITGRQIMDLKSSNQELTNRMNMLEQQHRQDISRMEQQHSQDISRMEQQEQQHSQDISRIEQQHRQEISRMEQQHSEDISRIEQQHRQDISRMEQYTSSLESRLRRLEQALNGDA